MANSTLSYFVLAGYGSMGRLRPLYCGLTLALYLWVLGLNGLLVLLICLERSLHRPMYLLLCGLFLNQLLGSSALLPFLARQVLAPVHVVPAHLCFLQVLCLYAYGNVEFCTLALICYDRHLAVCCPLQYSRRMSGGKALALLALTWLYGLLRPSVTVLLSARLPLCGNVLDGLYCQNYLISRLSCSGSGSRLSNIYGLLGLLPSVLLPLLAILVSYGKILRICFSASGRARRKALSTCAPHLASLLNFSFGCCFQIVQSRFLERRWPPPLRAFLELYFLLMQPLLSPVMYGLQLSGIRGAVGRRLRREPGERLGAAQVRG
ncbi:putative olfactory receptor 2I1 [Synchiropus picturatus]